jgi:putative selenate reductase molybdopterin-binding subunit
MAPGAPVIHDEPSTGLRRPDPRRNLAAEIRIDIGDVEAGFARADRVFEDEYVVPKVQQVSIEPHVVVTYWDEDDRLVIRTSTQVPFHVRRILAPVLNLPPRRIRVIKPRIGGGFGSQEVLIEGRRRAPDDRDRPAGALRVHPRRGVHLGAQPHPMRVRLRPAYSGRHDRRQRDGRALGHRRLRLPRPDRRRQYRPQGMALYPARPAAGRASPAIRYYADIVYTNTPPAGPSATTAACRNFLPLEAHMEWIAREMGWDPLGFRLQNAPRRR